MLGWQNAQHAGVTLPTQLPCVYLVFELLPLCLGRVCKGVFMSWRSMERGRLCWPCFCRPAREDFATCLANKPFCFHYAHATKLITMLPTLPHHRSSPPYLASPPLCICVSDTCVCYDRMAGAGPWTALSSCQSQVPMWRQWWRRSHAVTSSAGSLNAL